MLKSTVGGIAAGVLISIGGSVFLACESKPVGSVLFCVALICICAKGYILFTGKVGYLAEDRSKVAVSQLLLGLFGNAIGTVLCGLMIRYALPALGNVAETICTAKLEQVWLSTLIRGCFCGALMYLAVSIYKEKNTYIGILFCVPVFILSGFEHSVADMFYFAASGIVSLKAFGFLWTVVLGNTIGAVLINLLGIASRPAGKEAK